MPQNSAISGLTGRRAYFRFLYGSHFWQALTDASWIRGMIRDAPRSAIPEGGFYDATDFLFNSPGIAVKRGGTSYIKLYLANGTSQTSGYLTTSTYAASVSYVPFPLGPQLVVVGNDGALSALPVTKGRFAVPANAVVSTMGSNFAPRDTPKFRIGGSKNFLVVTSNDGSAVPNTYDVVTVAALTGGPPKGKFAEVYKTRLVLGNAVGNESRLYFSPTPDITTTWDTAESWIDCDHAITGLAALSNVLLIFSAGNIERIIGSTPPPGTDMDRAPLASIGCTDARSIVIQDGNVVFANPRGVYVTNGTAPVSLTTQGNIEAYWQSLFATYDAATWTISCGIYGSYLFVSVLNALGSLVDTLACYLPRKAWWRMTNIAATGYAVSHGASEELYYADRTTPRAVALSGIFTPTAANKLDANTLPVEPMIEFRPLGYSPTDKRFGNALLSYDMRDAASDGPTLGLTVKRGAEANTSLTPPESPLNATSTDTRTRFTLGAEGTAMTIRLAQDGASAKTEVYALEVEQRALPYGELEQ